MSIESGASLAPGLSPEEEHPNLVTLVEVARSEGKTFLTRGIQLTAIAEFGLWFGGSAGFPTRVCGHTTATFEAAWREKVQSVFVAVGADEGCGV